MKRHFSILLFLCLICLLATSCAKNEASQSDVQESLAADEILGNDDTKVQEKSITDDIVDVDLTALSSTMTYAEVFNIMMDPDSYVGKTIIGSGVYNSFYYEEMDRYFHYFIISDATGCCPQGLDFVWNGEHIYPKDYPEIGENIEVTGVFIKGDIDGQPYYHLAVDNMTVLEK